MKIWTTKDGVEIPIKKLTDGHIVNIIRYFFKNALGYKAAAVQSITDDALSAMSYCGGEMAEHASQKEGEELMELADYNAILVKQDIPAKNRLELLRSEAISQLKSLSNYKYLYPIESPNLKYEQTTTFDTTLKGLLNTPPPKKETK